MSQKTEPRIAYDDLREWLRLTERLGELREVKGATWQEDIGLAAEAILRAENGPCVLFDEIPGCPKGFRVLLKYVRRRSPQHDAGPRKIWLAAGKIILPAA